MSETKLAFASWLLLGLVACTGEMTTEPLSGDADSTVAPSTPRGAPTANAPATPAPVTPPATPSASNTPPRDSATMPAAPAQMPAAPVQMPAASAGDMPRTASDAQTMLAMDECGLNTKWQGDEYCINPPPADKGFQVHVGPSNYDTPEPRYVLEPGEEITETFQATSGNERDIYYYFRQYRMRPGSHHMILAAAGPEGRRLGGSQNGAKDNPELGVIAPENQGVGMQLGAKTPLSINLHYLNNTSAPILKEVWVNFWYRDPSEVREPAVEMFSMAPMNVPPGQTALIRGECPISEAGRVLQLYGHRHANNRRFSVFHTHAGKRDLVYEDYDWEHPLFLEFSSTIRNSAADPAAHVGGGLSGPLELAPGDTLGFECEVVNMTDKTFVGRNEAIDDEMCIMVGDTVGAAVPPRCNVSTTPLL